VSFSALEPLHEVYGSVCVCVLQKEKKGEENLEIEGRNPESRAGSSCTIFPSHSFLSSPLLPSLSPLLGRQLVFQEQSILYCEYSLLLPSSGRSARSPGSLQ